jgi:SAM-dependent methyltransferase
MTSPDPIEQWKRDEAAVFEGWDFSYIRDRAAQDEPPWSYGDRARQRLSAARHVLDIDTGGGEQLLALAPLPPGAAAIESYHPNVAVARERLAPLAVDVQEVTAGAPFPFGAACFDLVLNCHGHLNGPEIARVLRPGGVFLTQQVGGGNLADLTRLFGASVAPGGDNTLDGVSAQLEAAGLAIMHGEAWTGRQSFSDVGALVYFLKAIPWVAPGFGVATHRNILNRLQARLESEDSLSFSISRFLVEAVKPDERSRLTLLRRARQHGG